MNDASLAEFARHPMFGHHIHEFMSQAGQPRKMWVDFCAAMGIAPDGGAVPPPVTARFGAVQGADTAEL